MKKYLVRGRTRTKALRQKWSWCTGETARCVFHIDRRFLKYLYPSPWFPFVWTSQNVTAFSHLWVILDWKKSRIWEQNVDSVTLLSRKKKDLKLSSQLLLGFSRSNISTFLRFIWLVSCFTSSPTSKICFQKYVLTRNVLKFGLTVGQNNAMKYMKTI